MKKVDLYLVSAMDKIIQNTEIIEEENFGSLFINETYSFMVVLFAQENIEKARIVIESELDDNCFEIFPVDEIIADKEVEWYIDEYRMHSDDLMYPELCSINQEFSLYKNRFKSILVNIKNPSKIGTYNIRVKLLIDGEVVSSKDYKIEIIDYLLKETDLMITHWVHPDCIAALHNVEIFSDDFYEVLNNYLDAYVEMGNNMLLIPQFTLALDTAIGKDRMTAQLVDIYKNGDKYSFDFKRLDKYVKFAFNKGIKYLEFSHIFTQWGAEFCPKILAYENGELKKIFGWETQSVSDDYNNFLTQYLVALKQYIFDNHLEKISYIHLSDEPNEKALERYERHYKFVKPLIGNLPTLDALSHYEFYEKGVVDLPVVITSRTPKFCESNVKHMAYYCCVPCDCYESNRFFVMNGERVRIIGMQLYKNNALGFLHWGFNFYFSCDSQYAIDPYKITSCTMKLPSGDAFIVYPYKKGVLKSIRFYYMIQAFQDYRALITLETMIGKERVEDLLNRYGINGYSQYPHSSKILKKLREEINELIKKNKA